MVYLKNNVGSPFNTFKSSSNLIQRSINANGQNNASQPIQPQQVTQAVVQSTTQQQTQQPVVNVSSKHVEQYIKDKIKKAVPYVSAGMSLLAMGTSLVVLKKTGKAAKRIEKQLTELNNKITTTTADTPTKKNLTDLASFVIGLAGAGTGAAMVNHFEDNKSRLINAGIKEEDFNKSRDNAKNTIDSKDNEIRTAKDIAQGANSKSDQALTAANALTNKDSMALETHRKPYYGLNLLIINNDDKYVNKGKLKKALDDIHNAVSIRNNRKPGETEAAIINYKKKYVPLMASNSTWSVTAEYDPIKAGGLGSVPMEIHNNWADMGIDNPVFIPVYQFKGKSEFIETGDEKTGKSYKYIYGGDTFNLEKMAEMPVTQYRGNKVVNQKVEFYLGHANRSEGENPEQPLVFVKNTDNFGGDIYANGFNSDEPEKFAFLSKAVYQLAKAKVSEALGESKTGLGEIKIVNKKAYDEIKPPVAMMLNDWHAAPVAGLLRYRAPMENAYNEISDKVKDALRDMPTEMVGHNAGIPGSTRGWSTERSDMVTENIINTLYDGYAMGIVENAHTGRGPESVCNSILWERTDANNRQFNNLAHGISLADFYVPVSENYDTELKNDVQSSGLAYDAIQGKKDSGSIKGIINGLDRDTNSIVAKAEWLNKKFGMNVEQYNYHTPIDLVMDARQHNKGELYDHYIKPIQDGKTSLGGYNFNIIGSTPTVGKEDFMNAPVFAFAHRLTSQKGAALFAKAVIETFNTWDEKHPGKPKPFVIAGGQLEDKDQRQYLEQLKNPDNYKNKEDVNRVLASEGFMPNPALYAGATYFVAPSTFEPCGLTQGECYAMATPIITTATGGFVDTVKDGVNGFVSEYKSYHQEVERNGRKNEEWIEETGHALASKFNEAIDTYFNKPEAYKQIVNNNNHMDLSWNRGTEDDAIHQHMDVLNIKREDIVESNIAGVRKKLAKAFNNLDKYNDTKSKNEDTTKIEKALDASLKACDRELNHEDGFRMNLEKKTNTTKADISKVQHKIAKEESEKKESKRPDLIQTKIDNLTMKNNKLSNKVSLREESLKILKKDTELFNLINDKNINLNAPEMQEVKNWKEEICKKYSV